MIFFETHRHIEHIVFIIKICLKICLKLCVLCVYVFQKKLLCIKLRKDLVENTQVHQPYTYHCVQIKI